MTTRLYSFQEMYWNQFDILINLNYLVENKRKGTKKSEKSPKRNEKIDQNERANEILVCSKRWGVIFRKEKDKDFSETESQIPERKHALCSDIK